MFNKKEVPKNTVALIHTHGCYLKGYDNENFSREYGIGWDSSVVRDPNLPFYLVIPRGKLRRFVTAGWLKGEQDPLIAGNMPSEPNVP